MKKSIAAFAFIALFIWPLCSQASTDPRDSFYSLVERWEIMGLIKEQPPLRPYSLSLIEKILTEVIEEEHETESEAAQDCYERIFNKKYKIKLNTDVNIRNGTDNTGRDTQLSIVAGVDGDYPFSKYVSGGYKINVVAVNDISATALPQFTAQPYYFHDEVNLKKLEAYLEMDTSCAVGTEKVMAQLGVNHNSFGPFYNDNAVISPNAIHTANFSFLYNGDRIKYTQAVLGLSASNASKENDARFSKKFLAMHSLNGSLFKWLDLSYYEVCIYGDRFEPAYIVPAPYIITQGLSGFDDNIFMGLSFTVRPVPDFVWVNDFFVDDIGLEDIIRLNFDTKIRGTYQSAFKYVPSKISWFDMVKLDYTLVSPYMYAHKQNIIDSATGEWKTGTLDAINYQEYTNAGEPLGLSLPPNTERVGLSASFTPVKNLKLSVGGSYTRHANVNESLPVEEALGYLNSPEGYFATDGTLHNHQHYLKDGDPEKFKYLSSAWNHFLFMDQKTKMQVFRADLGAEYLLNTSRFGSLTVGFGYTFEHIKNYGVDRDIFTGRGGHYVFTEDEDGNSVKKWVGNATEADVEASLTAWRKGLYDLTNHYVKVFFKYMW